MVAETFQDLIVQRRSFGGGHRSNMVGNRCGHHQASHEVGRVLRFKVEDDFLDFNRFEPCAFEYRLHLIGIGKAANSADRASRLFTKMATAIASSLDPSDRNTMQKSMTATDRQRSERT